MQSTQWYPLQEVSSNLQNGSTRWELSDQKTDVRDHSCPQTQTVFDTREQPSTPTHDQSSQTADLTITSYLTDSPPKHFPPPQLDSPNDKHSQSSQQHSSSHHTTLQSYSSPALLRHTGIQTPSPHSSTHSFPFAQSSHRKHYPPMVVLNELTSKPQPYSNDSSVSSFVGKDSGNRLLAQQVSLLELDKLWRQFLTSSLRKKNITSVSYPNCTCGAIYAKQPSSLNMPSTCSTHTETETFPQTSDLHRQFQSLSLTTPQLVNRSVQTSQNDIRSTSKPAAFAIPTSPPRHEYHQLQETPRQAVSFSIPCTPYSSPTTTPSITGSSPVLATHPTEPYVPGPVLNTLSSSTTAHTDVPNAVFSSKIATHPITPFVPGPPKQALFATRLNQPDTTSSHSVDGRFQEACMAPVSRLSLSEAFLLQRPDFILRSQRRERRVREMSEIRRERRRRTLLNKAVHSQSECPPRKPSDKTSPSYYILSGHGTRPRMGHRQMFRRTKRAWQALPEVRRRVEEERKRAQAETNRLRVKLYQKEVLARMRKRSTRQN